MLATRTPLRISFFGGGTDIPSVYRELGYGAVFSATINRYIYIFVNHKFKLLSTGISAKYSDLEEVPNPKYLKHPIMRSILTRLEMNDLDISISSDIPGGTGMGSSSAFTVGFLKACFELKSISLTNLDIAKIATDIEINELKEPIGKQDTYAAALGGVNHLRFTDDEVTNHKTGLGESELLSLQDSTYLLSVGKPRKTSELLSRQLDSLTSNSKHLEIYEKMRDQADWARGISHFCPYEFGSKVQEAWALKRQLSDSITNEEVEGKITLGLKAGSTGAKLLGAGGSGFILFIVPKEKQIPFISQMSPLDPFKIKLITAGTEVMYSDEEKSA
jgi:D-glycero-alpha-D-manno-heptose-7-phosphate kinase